MAREKDYQLEDLNRRFGQLRPHINNVRDRMNAKWEEYQKLKAEQDRSWSRLQNARTAMNAEFDQLQRARGENQQDWERYKLKQELLSGRIEDARHEANKYASNMKDWFQRASDAYSYGNKADAKSYSEEGHRCKEIMNGYNQKVAELCRESQNNKERFERNKSSTDKDRFNSAKSEFENLRSVHERVQSKMKTAKRQHSELKQEYVKLKDELEQIQKAQKERIAELKRVRKEREEIALAVLAAHRYDASRIAEKLVSGSREDQYDKDGMTVKVKSGFSRKYWKNTTDILIFDHEKGNDYHYHVVYDEDGNELINSRRKNH